ncbi:MULTISPECIES: DUF4189 domain-containing protein [Xanthomonas]|uniref:DUF4189 domain-containing protein n=2 Tax=Xanthomonas TaxID=338 RepID=UPI0009B7F4B2|nr:DUF4189 domain-containing protein [Xanthomonas citri]ATS63186.1 DUF4189 domain-containing protein [Xanthomonas citri pv. phaseoli var. fuscans]ATS71778.1 DUF4189 domain-containing protein [Xanthomonas citri pv. phaseoli var. fuscans]ATS74544.1 DUF4189 domain-containing protein [Xanthomonas citri pv. phaseoli var. fuscans]
MTRFLLGFFMSFGLIDCSLAQTACPVAVAPGSPQCGPDSGTSRGDIPAPAPRPTGEWIKTWGTIAGSNATGETGAVVGKLTREEAESAALRLCREGGATDCKVNLVFRNQCAALVATTNKSFFQSAESDSIAIRLARSDCNKYDGGDCKVIYSGCSDPIFRKY